MFSMELGAMVLCVALAVWVAYAHCRVEEAPGGLDDPGDWQPS
ncbi:MAG: hypothetical protein VKQ33_10685 [Candidatus Sericytochromatia bacterium]|nr:hypothetical protein [Candidatus Sericytochromatia bacterium]